MSVGSRIKDRRKALDMTADEVADALGVARSTIFRYENGDIEKLPITALEPIAAAIRTTPAYLMGWTSDPDIGANVSAATLKKGYIRIPVLGTVRAGIPAEAIEDIIDWEDIPESLARGAECVALRIKGDSMEPRICEGDVVIVRRQENCETGDLAVVIVNGDEATVKRIKKRPEGLMLTPTNPLYEPFFFTNEEIQSLPVTIYGKVVELRAKF